MDAVKKQEIIVHELLDLAGRLGVRVRRERLGDDDVPVQSGMAWVDHQPVLFLDSRLSSSAMVDIMVRELADFPLDHYYLKPGIRALFEHHLEDDATPG